MNTQTGAGAIRNSVGNALRFHRGNIGFVLAVAGVGALAQTAMTALLGGTLILWAPLMALASAAVYAVLTRAALTGAATATKSAPGDTGRALGAGAIVSFIAGLLALGILFFVMSVLLAPYAEQANGLKQDQAALRALLEQAVQAQPALVAWSGLIGTGLVFVLTSGFFLAVPASVERGRIAVFASWPLGRRALFSIMGARVLLCLPALIFVGALQSLLGFAMGLGLGDPFAMLTRAQASPATFLVFLASAQFLQLAIYTALEAALSAELYRYHSAAEGKAA